MKKVGRVIAFLVAVLAVGGAAFVLVSFVGGALSGGPVSLGVCSLTTPDVFIEYYLDSRADELSQPAGLDDSPVTFIVEQGETAEDIAQRLEEQGLVRDGELFRRYVQYYGLDAEIEAGEFTLRQTMTIPEIAETLQEGEPPQQTVMIPEGLRLEQIAEAAAEQTTISKDAFLILSTTGWRDLDLEYGFLTHLPEDATLEGFLFPDTYRLPEEATATDLLRRMLGAFDARVTDEIRASAANQGFDVYELVTLASIVEREAVLEDERPLIAGVYYNRLQESWRLDADPTVQYALGSSGEWWPQLSTADLDTQSPYNTYRNFGLPPGPICNPGLAAIRSTAYPADTEYFFFLADCTEEDGSHLFSVTQDEHLEKYEMCGGVAP